MKTKMMEVLLMKEKDTVKLNENEVEKVTGGILAMKPYRHWTCKKCGKVFLSKTKESYCKECR